MPDNNFEKRLQEQMEGFKLQPSEQVWSEVELRIRKKKDRRRIIFWWLVPALLIGGGIFTAVKFLNNDDKKMLSANEIIKASEKENTITEIEAKPETGATGQENKTITDPELTNKEMPNSSISANSVTFEKPLIATATGKKNNSQKIFLKEHKPSLKDVVINKKGIAFDNNENKDSDFNMSITDPVEKKENEKKADAKPVPWEKPAAELAVINNSTKPEINNKQAVAEPGKTQLAVIFNNDSASSDIISTQDIAAQKTESDSGTAPAAPKAVVKLKKKWQFGFSFEAGASDLRTSLISGTGNAQKSFDVTALQIPYNNVITIPGAAEERRDAAFSVKAFMRKNIRRRLDLQAGISYSYFSTVTNVGNRVNIPTALNYVAQDVRFLSGFYNAAYTAAASSVKNDYINHYHLAGLYGQLNWRVTNWKKKAAIYWNNGLSINQLFTSDALIFNQTGSVYYKDFDAFQKQMAGISSALSFRLYNTNKLSITAGPFMQYYLTPQLKDAGTDNKHFRNYGINMQILFKK
jgi:hypothetical protein